jgi:hypothetical protein
MEEPPRAPPRPRPCTTNRPAGSRNARPDRASRVCPRPAGRWSTPYIAADDYRYYAVSYGVRSPVGQTLIPN